MNWRILEECVEEMARDDYSLSELLEFKVLKPAQRKTAVDTLNRLMHGNDVDMHGGAFEGKNHDFSKVDGNITRGPWKGMTYKILSVPEDDNSSFEFELLDPNGNPGEALTAEADLAVWWLDSDRMVVASRKSLQTALRLFLRKEGVPLNALSQFAGEDDGSCEFPYKKDNGSVCIRFSMDTLRNKVAITNWREMFGGGDPNHVPLEDKRRSIGDLEFPKTRTEQDDERFDDLVNQRRLDGKQTDFQSMTFVPYGPTLQGYINMLSNGTYLTSNWFSSHVKDPKHIDRIRRILRYRGFGNIVEVCKEDTIYDPAIGAYWVAYTDTSIMLYINPNTGELFNVMAVTPKKISDVLGLKLSKGGHWVGKKSVMDKFRDSARFRFPKSTLGRLNSLVADRYEDMINHPNKLSPGSHTTFPTYSSSQFPVERALDWRRRDIADKKANGLWNP